MRLDQETARRRFAAADVARLATVGSDGRPHLVPIVFAVSRSGVVYSAVDDKPKSTRALRRLANVSAHPAVCLLADRYAPDWSQLWWVRADGEGRVLDPGDEEALAAVDLLRERYPAYRSSPPRGPVLAVEVTQWVGWAAADVPGDAPAEGR
jgi:PPOX class probable F420-dependent enzyme